LVLGEKRLAGHVEDHPLDYGDFEGIIPNGESVIVWDRGRWSPIGDPRKGYAKGQLDFELQAVNSRAGGSASFPDAHRPSARRDRSCATSSGNLSRRSAVLDESRAHGGRRHVHGINSSWRALLS
jgi:ATP-dependent DNA ligase